MISRLKWSKYDWILVIIVLLVLVKLLAPDSGFHAGVHVFFHWLAIGSAWLGNVLAALFNVV